MEGTAIYVLKFPTPWSRMEEFTLLSGSHNEATVTLIVCCDGHLRLTVVNDSATPSIYYATQPINILGSGWAILSICWKDEDAQIYINGNKLKTCVEAPFETLCIETKDKEESIDTTYSFEHSDAIPSCQGQMKSREHLISSPTSDRVPRPIDEQLNDLKNSIESLCNFTTDVYVGNI